MIHMYINTEYRNIDTHTHILTQLISLCNMYVCTRASLAISGFAKIQKQKKSK